MGMGAVRWHPEMGGSVIGGEPVNEAHQHAWFSPRWSQPTRNERERQAREADEQVIYHACEYCQGHLSED